MARTYVHRRKEVREGTLSLIEILEKYPALKLKSCVSNIYLCMCAKSTVSLEIHYHSSNGCNLASFQSCTLWVVLLKVKRDI